MFYEHTFKNLVLKHYVKIVTTKFLASSSSENLQSMFGIAVCKTYMPDL